MGLTHQHVLSYNPTYHRTDKKVDSTIWKQTTTINIDTKYGDYGVGTADIEGA